MSVMWCESQKTLPIEHPKKKPRLEDFVNKKDESEEESFDDAFEERSGAGRKKQRREVPALVKALTRTLDTKEAATKDDLHQRQRKIPKKNAPPPLVDYSSGEDSDLEGITSKTTSCTWLARKSFLSENGEYFPEIIDNYQKLLVFVGKG